MNPASWGLMLMLFPAAVWAESNSVGVWLDVPFVRQEKNGCGAASIAMLMRYWGREETDAQQIYADLYSKDQRGIRGSDVEQFLQAHGFRTFVFPGEWQDFKHHLVKGRPLIVCLKKGTSLHFVVVVGVDSARGLLFINDPARRKLLRVERAEFESDWIAVNRWTLLAVPWQIR